MSIFFPVMEAYKPKSKELLEAEKHIAELIKFTNIRFTANIFSSGDTSYLKNENLKKLNECLAKDTGCRKLNVNIIPQKSFNAFTIPIGIIMSADSNEDVFTNFMLKHATIDVFASASLFSGKFTPEEVLAIILHEIGHNVDNSISNKLYSAIRILNTTGMCIPLSYLAAKEVALTNKIQDWLSSTLRVSSLRYELGSVLERLEAIAMPLFLVAKLPLYIFSAAYRFLTLDRFLRKGKERFSDKYAVERGYGAALSSGFKKFEFGEYNDGTALIDNAPAPIKISYDLCEFLFTVCVEMMSPHDPNMNRILICRQTLVNNLNDPLIPSHVKKDIKKQIDEIDLVVKELENKDNLHNKYRIFSNKRRDVQKKVQIALNNMK